MKIYELFEARKNPDKNKKENIYDVLLEYSEDSNTFIHTTSVSKVGINPRTAKRNSDDSPLGVYAFHLQSIKTYLERGKENNFSLSLALPFYGGDNIYILRSTDPFEDTLQTYTESDLSDDIEKLRATYGHEKINRFLAIASSNENYVNKPIGKLWAVTKAIAIGDPSELSHSQYPDALLWNKILRELGFSAMHDKGYGWIHGAEPSQSLFLVSSAYETIDHHHNNRKQSSITIGDKEYRGGRLPKDIRLKTINSNDLMNLERTNETMKVRSITIQRLMDTRVGLRLRSIFPKARVIVKEVMARDAKITIPPNMEVDTLVFTQEFPILPSQIEHLERIQHQVKNIKYTEASVTKYGRIKEPESGKYSKELFSKISKY